MQILCYHPGVQFTLFIFLFTILFIAIPISWFSVCDLFFFLLRLHYNLKLSFLCHIPFFLHSEGFGALKWYFHLKAPLSHPSCYCCTMTDINEYSLINAQINLIWDLYTWFGHTNNHFCNVNKKTWFERAGLEKKFWMLHY